MKKILFVFGLLYSFYGSVIGQPGVIGVEKAVYEERTVADEGDCISVSFNLGKNLIVIGCDDYNYNSWKTNVVIRKLCGSGFLDEYGCRFEIRYFINNEYIGKQTLNKSPKSEITNVLPIKMNELADILGKEYKEKTAELAIEIWEMCSVRGGTFETKKQTFTQTLQVVNYDSSPENQENNKYIVTELVKSYSQKLCGDEIYISRDEIDDIKMCCSGERTITLDNIKTDGNNLELSGGIGIPTKYVLNLSLSEKHYRINETTVKDSYIFNLKATKGKCVYPGILLNFNQYETYYRYVSCEGEDPIGEIIEDYVVLTKPQLAICELENPCGELPPYKIKIRNREIVNREIASGCIGDILFDFEYEGENYEYEWTGPSGEKYYTKNLIGVPYGKYELTIYDECCNEHNETVNLCDEMNYINWEYKNGEYCADVVCACSSEDTDPLNYIMCVTPQRYDSDWSFDDSRKMCTKNAYWTDQNGVEIDLTDAVNEDDIDAEDENVVKEPIIDDHYDNTTKQCVRDYYCETDETSYNHIVQPPTNYGAFWNFESFDNTCHREVYCFDNFEPVEEEQIIDAEINWTFNLVTGMCDATVYCDGFQQYGAYVPPHFPYDQTEWMLYTPDDTHCQKTVTCEYGEEETVEVGMTIDVNVDGTCPTDQPNHIIWYCNNEFVADDCLGPEATEELINNSNFSETSIDKIAGLMTIYPNPYQDNVKITIVSDNKTNLKIDLLSITGKKIVSKTQKITKGENSFLLNDVKDIKKGMYFLHLYDNQNISYTYKLIKE